MNLENGDLGQKLADSSAECQHRQSKADGGILEGNEVESSIGEDAPDEDVADDAGSERVGVVVGKEGACTDPVESDKGPRKREGKGRGVDEERGAWVAEIADGQVEEVDHNQKERKPEVATGPQVDETEQEKVGGDVVRRNVSSGGEVNLGGGLIEREEVVELENKNDDPVDACDDAVLGKSGWSVLAPDSVLVVDMDTISVLVVVFGGCVECVINGRDEKEDVGDCGGDLVD